MLSDLISTSVLSLAYILNSSMYPSKFEPLEPAPMLSVFVSVAGDPSPLMLVPFKTPSTYIDISSSESFVYARLIKCH